MINTVTKKYDTFTNNFVSYQIVYNSGLVATVPLDPANTDYQAIQEWIAEGNTVIDNGGNE